MPKIIPQEFRLIQGNADFGSISVGGDPDGDRTINGYYGHAPPTEKILKNSFSNCGRTPPCRDNTLVVCLLPGEINSLKPVCNLQKLFHCFRFPVEDIFKVMRWEIKFCLCNPQAKVRSALYHLLWYVITS